MANDPELFPTDMEVPELDEEQDTQLRTGPLSVIDFLIAILLVGGLQLVGLYTLIARGVPLLYIGLGHIGLTALLLLWALIPRRADPRPHMTLVMASGMLFVFGTLGSAIAFGVREFGVRRRIGGAGWHALLFPTTPLTRRERIQRRAQQQLRQVELPGEFAPLADVFERGRAEERIQIVPFLARNFQPRYADTLRRALGDPNPAIRAQAAGVAAAVEQRMADKLRWLQHAHQAVPDDPDRIRALAEHYDDYAHAGLLSGTVAWSYRERAVALYRELLAHDDEDEWARMYLVRLLLRMDRGAEALELVDAMPREISDLTAWFAWLAEMYYRNARYADLRQLCLRAEAELSVSDVPVSIHQAILTWARTGHAEETEHSA